MLPKMGWMQRRINKNRLQRCRLRWSDDGDVALGGRKEALGTRICVADPDSRARGERAWRPTGKSRKPGRDGRDSNGPATGASRAPRSLESPKRFDLEPYHDP